MSFSIEQRERLQDTAQTFKRYYFLILRRLWLILLIVAVAMVATWAWLERQPPIYASTATILVEQAERKVVKIEDVESKNLESLEYLNTVIQSLGTQLLMERVVTTLKLDQDPDFTPPKPDGSAYTVSEIAASLGKKVNAKLRRLTRLIDITVEDTDPRRAQLIAEHLVAEFLKQGYEQNAKLSRAANEFLFQEADKLKARLEASDEKLQRYREDNQAVSLEERQNIIVDKLKEINAQVNEAKAERLRLESDLEQIKLIDPSNTEELMRIESVAKLPQVAEVRSQITRGQSELAALRKRYLPDHPKYIQGLSQIANLGQSLAAAVAKAGDSVAKRYEAAVETEQKLNAALKDQEKVALELNKIAIPYNVLAREVASDRSMYDAVITRLREMMVTQGLDKTPFRLVEEPRVATSPVKRDRIKVLQAALLLSVAAAIGLVLALDSIDPSFRSVDEIESALKVPVIAAIQDAGATKIHNLLVSDPKSAEAESFRTLYTSLSLMGPEGNRRTFLITSATPAEGKTFTALHCATAFAQNGLKTVLIDADLRRPTLHREILDGKSEYLGLSDYLSDLATIDQTIAPTSIENLHFIPAGRHCPNPSLVFSRPDFPDVIAGLLKDFDRVIVDSAPVNAVSDTLLIAKHFHGVCLVVRSGKTPRAAVQRGLRLLEQAGANVVGTVLNRLPKGRGAGYYYYYYGDEYAKSATYGTARA